MEFLILQHEASWDVWAEEAMCNEAMMYQDGGRLVRGIIDIMEKGETIVQVYIGFQDEPMD
jgi:hypothetical protein